MAGAFAAPPRALEFCGRRCACGRTSLILARCGACIWADADLAEEARATADAEDELIGVVGAAANALARVPGPARLVRRRMRRRPLRTRWRPVFWPLRWLPWTQTLSMATSGMALASRS